MAPGVTILDEEPQIRGGSGFTFGVGAKVGVFIDDLPIITGDAGKPDWALIPVENIKQIEVVKGASSVLSGASASKRSNLYSYELSYNKTPHKSTIVLWFL